MADCEYTIAGDDRIYSESEFKKLLSEGYLDKVMIDNKIKIRNIKPNEELAKVFQMPTAVKSQVESISESKENVVQVQNPRKEGYQNTIVKKSESTNESGDKVTEYTAYAVDENGNERKMTGNGISTTVGEFAPLVKPEEGDSNIFYDEDRLFQLSISRS